MSYVTRDLLSFSLSRNSGEIITLIIKTKTGTGDGSYSRSIDDPEIMARVVDLQPNEIKRLQDRGITLLKGVSIGIPSILEKIPDQIRRADGTIMKIVDFTRSENGTVMIADVPPLGPAA